MGGELPFQLEVLQIMIMPTEVGVNLVLLKQRKRHIQPRMKGVAASRK